MTKIDDSKTVIYMRSVPAMGDDWRSLVKPLPCPMWDGWVGPEYIPAGFTWNGHSSGLLSPIFPKWNHPISSCRHDWRCRHARTSEQRAWADREFKKDVATTSWWVTAQIGYLGVRLGALFGVGNQYRRRWLP